jgi:hypothetical protein
MKLYAETRPGIVEFRLLETPAVRSSTLCLLTFLFTLALSSGCAPGLDEGRLQTAGLGHACQNTIDCLPHLECREQSCVETGPLPRQWGSIEKDIGWSVAVTDENEVFVAGIAHSGLDGQTGKAESNAFLTKLNAQGTKLWTNLWGSDQEDAAACVEIAADGAIYVTGRTRDNSAFLARFLKTGELEWMQFLTDAEKSSGTRLAADPEGNVYVAYCEGCADILDKVRTMQTYTGMPYIAKFDAQGNRIWVRSWQGRADVLGAIFQAAGLDPQGNLLLAGWLVFKSEDNPNIPTSDSFVAGYRPDGELIWLREYDLGGQNLNDAILDLAIDQAGNLYTTGTIVLVSYEGQAHLTHLDNAGQLLWTQAWQSETVDCGFGVDLVADKILVTGWSMEVISAQSLDLDLTVTEFDLQGLELKRDSWESGSNEGGLATATAPDQAVLITGWSTGSLFAPNPGPAGTGDIILMRIDPP